MIPNVTIGGMFGRTRIGSPQAAGSRVLKLVAEHSLWSSIEYLGLNALLRRYNKSRLLILCYHGVVPDECCTSPLVYGNSIGTSDFLSQMSQVGRLFQPIEASQVEEWLEGHLNLRNPVLVTFDDGYKNNWTHAAPVLLRLGIPALINVCTGFIGQPRILWPDEIYSRVLFCREFVIPMPGLERSRKLEGDIAGRMELAAYLRERCKLLPEEECERYLNQLRERNNFVLPPGSEEILGFLSWDEVRALQAKGFAIGSHTVNHSILTRVKPETLVREVRDSKCVIEGELSSECPYFCYPNGGPLDYSPSVLDAVRQAGYRIAFTTRGQLCSRGQNPLMLDRAYIPAPISSADFLGRISGFRSILKLLRIPAERERFRKRGKRVGLGKNNSLKRAQSPC